MRAGQERALSLCQWLLSNKRNLPSSEKLSNMLLITESHNFPGTEKRKKGNLVLRAKVTFSKIQRLYIQHTSQFFDLKITAFAVLT